MRAVVVERFGPPGVLRAAEVAVPEPSAGQVLVRVRAAGVNAIDWLTRAGLGVRVSGFPAILGWDMSGTVVARGSGVTGVREGDDVFGMLSFPALASCYAEYVAAPVTDVALKPSVIDHRHAAGAPMPAITAWQALFRHADLRAGQRVLIHGAAGGVGHIATQLAHSTGAEVIATASARNRDFLIDLGADQVVDYSLGPISELVSKVDVVVDSRGGADFLDLVNAVRPGGIVVTLKGEQPEHRAQLEAQQVRAGYVYVGPDPQALNAVAQHLAHADAKAVGSRIVSSCSALGEAGGRHQPKKTVVAAVPTPQCECTECDQLRGECDRQVGPLPDFRDVRGRSGTR
ncbi:NADP-dependent oxidoreductase [Nocardia sp. GAS34]|uniref:NADP-dependent oxidoreductase n=1 Tax=unclassified Nocardia TaxID=2637762 RepID=UPI003D1FC64B